LTVARSGGTSLKNLRGQKIWGLGGKNIMGQFMKKMTLTLYKIYKLWDLLILQYSLYDSNTLDVLEKSF